MQHRLTTALFVSSLPFVSAAALAGDALSIRDLAPDSAFIVVGADDIHGTIDRLGPTALGKLWNDPALAEDVKKFKAGFEEGFAEAIKESGLDWDNLGWPSSVGVAVMASLDEELGLPKLQYVFFCDWTKEAEKATKFFDALLEKVQKEAKEAGAELKTEDVRGRRVVISKASDGDAEGAEGDADGGAGEDEDMGGDPFGIGASDMFPQEVCFASDKGRLFIASSKDAMDGLLARVDGERAKSVGDSATFKSATELAGGTQDIYAYISTEAAQPLLAVVPTFMFVEPLIKRFFGDIKAWSLGMHAKEGVLETCAGIYVPDGKVGLLSLVDAPTAPKMAPAIVPSDALSYGRMNVRFDRIMPMLDEVIGGLPPEQGDMIKPQLDIYRPAMTAAFAALGPEIHIWSGEIDAADPLAGRNVTAIAMKNDKESVAAVSDFINLLPMGLQSRDFNGMTILSDEFAPVAIGMGGGYLVLGDVSQVEQTLRAVDAKGEAGLAGDKQYQAAFAAMPKDAVVGTAWFNLAREMESSAKTMRTMMEDLEGMDALEEAEIPGLGVGIEDVVGFYDLMKPEVVRRCVGDGVLEFKSTPKGFSTVYRMMPAPAK